MATSAERLAQIELEEKNSSIAESDAAFDALMAEQPDAPVMKGFNPPAQQDVQLMDVELAERYAHKTMQDYNKDFAMQQLQYLNTAQQEAVFKENIELTKLVNAAEATDSFSAYQAFFQPEQTFGLEPASPEMGFTDEEVAPDIKSRLAGQEILLSQVRDPLRKMIKQRRREEVLAEDGTLMMMDLGTDLRVSEEDIIDEMETIGRMRLAAARSLDFQTKGYTPEQLNQFGVPHDMMATFRSGVVEESPIIEETLIDFALGFVAAPARIAKILRMTGVSEAKKLSLLEKVAFQGGNTARGLATVAAGRVIDYTAIKAADLLQLPVLGELFGTAGGIGVLALGRTGLLKFMWKLREVDPVRMAEITKAIAKYTDGLLGTMNKIIKGGELDNVVPTLRGDIDLNNPLDYQYTFLRLMQKGVLEHGDQETFGAAIKWFEAMITNPNSVYHKAAVEALGAGVTPDRIVTQLAADMGIKIEMDGVLAGSLRGTHRGRWERGILTKEYKHTMPDGTVRVLPAGSRFPFQTTKDGKFVFRGKEVPVTPTGDFQPERIQVGAGIESPTKTLFHEFNHALDARGQVSQQIEARIQTHLNKVMKDMSVEDKLEMFKDTRNFIATGKLGTNPDELSRLIVYMENAQVKGQLARRSGKLRSASLGEGVEVTAEIKIQEYGEGVIDHVLRGDKEFMEQFPEITRIVQDSGVVDLYRRAYAKTLFLQDVPTFTTLSQAYKNHKGVAAMLGDSLLYGEVTKRQLATNDIILNTLHPNDFTWSGGAHAFDVGKYADNVAGWRKYRMLLTSPAQLFQGLDPGLVTMAREARFALGRMEKATRKAVNTTYKGLARTQKKELNRILMEGNEYGQQFNLTARGLESKAGQIMTKDAKVIDAYFSMRKLDDVGAQLVDEAFRRQSIIMGYKVTDSGQLLKPVTKTKDIVGLHDVNGVPITEDSLKIGSIYEEVQFSKGGTERYRYIPEGLQENAVREVPQGFQFMNRLEGHIPIIYKDPFRITQVTLDSETGKVAISTKWTAATMKEANLGLQNVESTAGENSFYLVHRSTEPIGSIFNRHNQVGMTGRTKKIMGNWTKQQVDDLLLQMKASGVEDDVLDNMEFFDHFEKPRGFNYAKKRSRTRLKDVLTGEEAPYLVPDEAISEYLMQASSLAEIMPLFAHQKEQFMTGYRHLLTDPSDWDSPFKNVRDVDAATFNSELSGLDLSAQMGEAKAVRRQLKINFGFKSTFEQAEARAFRSFADKLYDSSIYKKTWGSTQLTDRAATFVLERAGFTDAVGMIKGMTAEAKLGLFLAAQLPVQMTPMLNLGAKMFQWKGTAHVAGGMEDFTKAMFYARIGQAAGVPITEGSKHLFKVLENSGFVSRIDYDEVGNLFKGLVGRRSKTGKLLNYTKFFFKEGEAYQRASVWFVERRQLISEIEAGVAKGFKLKDVDSQAFLSEVNKRASVLAVDMNKINTALLFQGGKAGETPLGGIVGNTASLSLQFKQFQMKQAELVFGKQLTRSEKAGLVLTWGGVFGLAGVPFSLDAIRGMEEVEARATKQAGKLGSTIPNLAAQLATIEWLQDLAKPFTTVKGDMRPGMSRDERRAFKFISRMIERGAITAFTDAEFDIANRASIGRIFDGYVYQQSPSDLIFGPSKDVLFDMFKQIAGWTPELAAEGLEAAAEKLGIDPQNTPLLRTLVNLKGGGDVLDVLEVMTETEGTFFEKALAASPAARDALQPLSAPYNAAKAVEGIHRDALVDSKGRQTLAEPTLFQILSQGAGITPGKANEAQTALRMLDAQAAMYREWHKETVDEVTRLYLMNPELGEARMNKALQEVAEVNPMLSQKLLSDLAYSLFTVHLSPEMRKDLKVLRGGWLFPDENTINIIR